MRSLRTAAGALLGAATLLALAAPTALAKDAEPARVSPAEAAPGKSVTVSVTCDTSSVKTITAHSQAFSTGSATLTVGPDGKYSGSAGLASEQEFSTGSKKPEKGSAWGIDGACPGGHTFAGAVTVLMAGHESRDTHESQVAGAPHGGMRTGLGGSVTSATGTGELATGGALVVAGIGGFWLLRRRTGSST